jgi:hypothetical protein
MINRFLWKKFAQQTMRPLRATLRAADDNGYAIPMSDYESEETHTQQRSEVRQDQDWLTQETAFWIKEVIASEREIREALKGGGAEKKWTEDELDRYIQDVRNAQIQRTSDRDSCLPRKKL